MSLQTDQRTGLDELEALDFDYDPPCEHPNHGLKAWHAGSAWALVQMLPKPCGCAQMADVLYICRGSWDYAAAAGLYCVTCRAKYSREQGWRFIALVRP